MKAIVYEKFGGPEVLVQAQAKQPEVTENGVLVSLRASTVNVIDSRSRAGLLYPFVNKKFPKIPGVDVAGTVAAVGAKVTKFKIGDAVFGATNAFKGGALAEYVMVRDDSLALIPSGLGFEDAATLPISGVAALLSLRDLGKLRPGQKVLIHGSSGGTGLYAVQLAKLTGAHVTTVSGTQGAIASREMGADVSHDYKTGAVQISGKFDVILDYSGNFSFDVARPYLTNNGCFIESSPSIPKFLGSKLANPFRRQKNEMLQTEPKTKDLEYLSSLVVSRQLRVTVARAYAFEQAKDAFIDQEHGGVVGKLVINGPSS